jgi:O-antigen ligase
MTTVVDNEYLLYTRRYGVVGFLAYMGFFLAPWGLAVQALKRERQKRERQDKAIPEMLLPAAAYAVVLPAVLVYNFMAGIFYNLQIMTVFTVLMGFVYNGVIEARMSGEEI